VLEKYDFKIGGDCQEEAIDLFIFALSLETYMSFFDDPDLTGSSTRYYCRTHGRSNAKIKRSIASSWPEK
jgi:hypothetical protein